MSKPRIVLIGGWGQTSEVFAALAELLADFAEVRMTSVYELASDWESAGNELTSVNPPEALSCYAKQLHNEYLVGEPVTLFGWSMGAMVALEAAHRFAQSLQKLILVSGCASFCDREDGNYKVGTSTDDVEKMALGLVQDRKRTLEHFLINVYRRSVTKEALRGKAERSMQLSDKVLQHGLEYLRVADLRGELAQVAQPTLLLHGDQDRVISPAASEYLEQHLKNATLVQYTEGTHGICEQIPSKLAREIREFLTHVE